ncbi:MAG: adenylate/guanylate cyclase domain-containing protein [Granulosicoccus sp.]
MSEQSDNAKEFRRLRAIVFADVVGYSRMMAMDEVDTSVRVASLIKRCAELSIEYNGALIQTRGDGLFLLFDSVVDAVSLSSELQEMVNKESEALPDDKKIRLRIGVHMGDVIKADDQYVGDSVNIASRIEAKAGAGSICISGAVYEQVKHKLNLGFAYVGCLELKNIPDPLDLYEISNDTQVVLMSASPRSREDESKASLDSLIASKPLIAVLPFSNLDNNDLDDFFADGVTEDLITNLSRFHALAVISRSSTFVYKNRDVSISQVGGDLGAQYVVTGSIRKSSSRLRLTVELSDCRTSVPVWRERYNREIGDIFDLQDEITDLISSAIAVKTQSADMGLLGRIQVPALIETYSLVLKGQQKIFKYSQEQNVQARKMYEAALKNESDYSRAMAALSRTHNLDWRYSWTDSPEYALEKAHELAQESVLVDPSDARGYGELGFVNLYRKDHEGCLSAFETALRLNPNDTDVMSNMGDALAHCGRSEEAIALLNKALLLNPFYPDQYLWYLGGAYFNLKQYDDAVKTLKRMNSPAEGRRLLAACYAYLGRTDEAKQQAAKVLEAYPNFDLKHWENVQPDVNPEDTEHFVHGLRLAGLG